MITGLDCYEAFGDPNTIWDEGLYMTLWKVPDWITKHIETIPKRIYCNKEMIVPLEAAFHNVLEAGLADEIKTWDGCFQVRPIRGYEKRVQKLLDAGEVKKAMIYMSIHCWGIAFDINAAWNGLGKEPKMKPELANCFKEAGFDWGGDWKRKDGMHFQLSYLTTKTYRP